MEQNVKHGWFSQTAIDNGNTYFIYLNSENKQVTVTFVMDSEKLEDVDNIYLFKDKKYVGIVTKYILRKENT